MCYSYPHICIAITYIVDHPFYFFGSWLVLATIGGVIIGKAIRTLS